MDLLYLIRSGFGIPDYWHPALEFQRDFESDKVTRYPISIDSKSTYPGRLNEEEVPIIYVNGNSCVSPITVALYGLGNHDVFLASRRELNYRRMLSALHWLKAHCIPFGNGIGWPQEENLPSYGLNAPWFSGIAQGFVLSLFVRAHALERTRDWASFARATWRGYNTPIDEGGFSRKIQEGMIYEEYPGPDLDCVFNGMCHALIGLWDAWKAGVVPEAESSFQEGVSGLRALLPRFNHRGWSLYSLNLCLGKPLLASPYYHRANGLLAMVIGRMACDSAFCAYGDRWLKTGESIVRRVAMSLRIAVDRYLGAPALLHADKARNS